MNCRLDVQKYLNRQVKTVVNNLGSFDDSGFAYVTKDFNNNNLKEIKELNAKFNFKFLEHFRSDTNDLPNYVQMNVTDELVQHYINKYGTKKKEDIDPDENGQYSLILESKISELEQQNQQRKLSLVSDEGVSIFNDKSEELQDEVIDSNSILFKDENKLEYSTNEVLVNIIQDNSLEKSESGKFFLNKLFKLQNKQDSKVKIIEENVFQGLKNSIDETTVMVYDVNSNTILISKDRLKNLSSETVISSFIHEVVHSVTYNALKNPKTFEERQLSEFIKSNLENLKNQYESKYNKSAYGFENELEFVAEFYSNPSFQSEVLELDKTEKLGFWQELLSMIRRLFGLSSNIENNNIISNSVLLSKIENLVHSEGSKKNEGNIFNLSEVNILEKKIDPEMWTDLSTLDDKLNYTIKLAKLSLKENINNYTTLSNTQYNDKLKDYFKKKAKALKDVEKDIDDIIDTSKIGAVKVFANELEKSLSYVEGILNNLDWSDKDAVLKTKRIYDKYLSTLSIIEDIEQLITDIKTDSSQKIISKEELKELEDSIFAASSKYPRLEKQMINLDKAYARIVLNDIKFFPKIITEHRQRLEKEYKNAKLIEDKEAWISDKLLNRDAPLIQQDLDREVNKFIENPLIDISSVDNWMSTSTNMHNQMIDILDTYLQKLNNDRLETERLKDIEFKRLFDELVTEKGTNNIKKLYENILEFVDDKPFLKSEVKAEVYEKFFKEIKALREERRGILRNLYVELKSFEDSGNTVKAEEKTKEIQNLRKEYGTKIEAIENKFAVKNKEGRIIDFKAKYKNDLSRLSETEKKVLDLFKSTSNEGARWSNGNDNLVKYAYKQKFYELPKLTRSNAEIVYSGKILDVAKEKWKDFRKDRPDDIEFISKEYDLKGRPITRLRLHYRDKAGDFNHKEQSLDLFNLYRTDFKNINLYKERIKIQPEINMLMSLSKNKDYYTKQGSVFVKNFRSNGIQLQQGELSNTHKVMNNLVESKFYDILAASNTKLAGVDMNRAVAILNGSSATLALTFNLASATANVLNGSAQLFLESFLKGKTISAKSIAKAEGIYLGDMTSIMKDKVEALNTSKTNQLLESFNIFGHRDFSKSNFLNSSLIKKGFFGNTGQILQDGGEHWIQSIITMSVLDGIKVMNNKGEFINEDGKVVKSDEAASLLDMFVQDPNTGLYSISDKVGYTTHSRTSLWKEGGKEFIDALLYKKIYDTVGAYRTSDQPEIMRHWYGKLVMLYRRFFVPMAQARWTGLSSALVHKDDLEDHQKNYSKALQEYEEGTYVTLIRFLKSQLFTTKANLLTMDNWNNLSDYEKHNIKRSVTEIVLTSVILPLLTALVQGLADDEDEEYLWFLTYQIRRLDTELSTFYNYRETFKMMRSPIPSARLVETSIGTLEKLLPWSWDELGETYKTGPRKGENKFKVRIQKQIPIAKDLIRSYQDLYEFQDSNWGTGI